MSNDDPASAPTCPRCAHDIRGAMANWSSACELFGRCSECGFGFQWCEQVSPHFADPWWSVETGRGPVPWALRWFVHTWNLVFRRRSTFLRCGRRAVRRPRRLGLAGGLPFMLAAGLAMGIVARQQWLAAAPIGRVATTALQPWSDAGVTMPANLARSRPESDYGSGRRVWRVWIPGVGVRTRAAPDRPLPPTVDVRTVNAAIAARDAVPDMRGHHYVRVRTPDGSVLVLVPPGGLSTIDRRILQNPMRATIGLPAPRAAFGERFWILRLYVLPLVAMPTIGAIVLFGLPSARGRSDVHWTNVLRLWAWGTMVASLAGCVVYVVAAATGLPIVAWDIEFATVSGRPLPGPWSLVVLIGVWGSIFLGLWGASWWWLTPAIGDWLDMERPVLHAGLVTGVAAFGAAVLVAYHSTVA